MQQFIEYLFLLCTMQECGKKSKQDVDLFSKILYLAEFQTEKQNKQTKACPKYVSVYLATYDPAHFHTGYWARSGKLTV